MREKLIELLSVTNLSIEEVCCCADYLLANGVIKLPVNSGDTIYRPFFPGVESWIVETVILYPEEIVFIDDSENQFKECDIGVSVFLTKEEAEVALKGGE